MKYGDVVSVGRHRLMCGDATRYEDIEKLLQVRHYEGEDLGGVMNRTLPSAGTGEASRIDLILTDPPYGINIVDRSGHLGSRGRHYAPVIGDTNGDMFREHYVLIRRLCNRLIVWGGQNFTDILPPSCGWIFWDKDKNAKLSFGDGELAWTNCSTRIRKYTHRWNGNVGRNYELNPAVHPTMKPVELIMSIINDFTKPGDIILDCFGGSGTTLIAAELTGRTCLMMEISAEYCGIIVNRYNTLIEGRLPNLETL